MNPADVAQSALPSPPRRVADRAVLAGPLDREIGHAGAAGLFGLGLGDRDRQDLPVFAHQARDGPVRAGVLVRPVDRGALSRAVGQADAFHGGLFVAAMREWKRSFESHARSFAGLQMRIDKVMNVSIAREIERLERRLLVLATVGSAGPFVGLFGTVWGIMSSFQSIAASKIPRWRWWPPVSRRRCLRPPSALSPPFLRLFSTISSLPR